VLRLADDVVDDADVEAELAGELGLELADLEFNDDVAQLLDLRADWLRSVALKVSAGAAGPAATDPRTGQRLTGVRTGPRRCRRPSAGSRWPSGSGASMTGRWGSAWADASTAVGGACTSRPQLRVPSGSVTGHRAVAVFAD